MHFKILETEIVCVCVCGKKTHTTETLTPIGDGLYIWFVRRRETDHETKRKQNKITEKKGAHTSSGRDRETMS